MLWPVDTTRRHHRPGRSSAASYQALAIARASGTWIVRCDCGAEFVDYIDGLVLRQHYHAGHRYRLRANPARPLALR